MKSKTLLVIDMINDIIHKEGAIASCADYVDKYSVIQKTNQLIAHFRQKAMPIIFIRVGFQSDYSDCPPDWQIAAQKNAFKIGSWGTEIVGLLDFNKEKDILVTKARVSPFYKTNLEELLSKFQAEELIVTGVATNNAIDLCAREAWDRDFSVTVIKDACGAADLQHHEATLFAFPPVIKQLNTVEYLAEDCL